MTKILIERSVVAQALDALEDAERNHGLVYVNELVDLRKILRIADKHPAVTATNQFSVGDKIKFANERRRYTVQAASSRFLVCTKPFPLHKTVLYSIVDFERNIRGTENLVFGFGAKTREQCQEMLERLESGETEISYRNRVPLVIETGKCIRGFT